MVAEFGSIRPGDIEGFTFKFTDRVEPSNIINPVTWTCAVSPESAVPDPAAASRIIGVPSFTNVNASATAEAVHTTSCLVGEMLDGVIYTLTATVTVADGRVLSSSADLECGLRPSPESVPLTVEQFRAAFPAFADTTAYPDDQVNYWIQEALGTVSGAPVIDPFRWGQFYDLGLRLYVAHNLALERMAGLAAAKDGTPVGAGIPTSRSVGPASVSYDVEFGSEQDGGNWNLTIWGSRYIRLLRQAGMGPIQL